MRRLLAILLQIFANANTKYSNYRLEDLCDPNGRKVVVGFHFNSAKVFTFNSTVDTSLFQCHLELELGKTGDGFIVFIDEMDIQNNSACSRDYIQFGWDVGFVTTGLSDKMCSKLHHHESEEGKDANRLDYIRESGYSRRIYQKSIDEMDLWIELNQDRKVRKQLSLTVTPARNCDRWEDPSMMKCPQSLDCIHRDLFCDGKINCPRHAFDEDLDRCEDYVESGFFESPIGVPIIIILAIVLPIATVIFALSLFSICRKYIELCHSRGDPEASGAFPSLLDGALGRTRRVSTEQDRSDHAGALALSNILLHGRRTDGHGDREGGDHHDRSPESPPPNAPPLYTEIYKDEPPNYFDIVKPEDIDNNQQNSTTEEYDMN